MIFQFQVNDELTQSSPKITDNKGENLCQAKLFPVSPNSHVIVYDRTVGQEILSCWVLKYWWLIKFSWQGHYLECCKLSYGCSIGHIYNNWTSERHFSKQCWQVEITALRTATEGHLSRSRYCTDFYNNTWSTCVGENKSKQATGPNSLNNVDCCCPRFISLQHKKLNNIVDNVIGFLPADIGMHWHVNIDN